MTVLLFVQINAQHSRVATATLYCYLSIRTNSIALIQQPLVARHWICGLRLLKCTLFPEELQARLLHQFSGGILMTVQTEIQVGRVA